MSTFLITLLVSFVIIAIALLCMGIGYFVRRSDVLTTRCGFNPNKEKDGKCGTKKSCSLCGKNGEKDDSTDK